MYLESSAVVTPDPADPATYSVQDYAGIAVPWADVIRVRDGDAVIATAYRNDAGWYSDTVPYPANHQWRNWQECLAYQLASFGVSNVLTAFLLKDGWV